MFDSDYDAVKFIEETRLWVLSESRHPRTAKLAHSQAAKLRIDSPSFTEL